MLRTRTLTVLRGASPQGQQPTAGGLPGHSWTMAGAAGSPVWGCCSPVVARAGARARGRPKSGESELCKALWG